MKYRHNIHIRKNVIGLIVIIGILMAGFSASWNYAEVKQDDKILDYIYIGEIAVGGMSKAEARQIVKVNGVEKSRKEFNRSTYLASPKVIIVGTNTSSAEARAYIQNAIASQNESTIYSAVQTAARIAVKPQERPAAEKSEEEQEPQEKPAAEKSAEEQKPQERPAAEKPEEEQKSQEKAAAEKPEEEQLQEKLKAVRSGL